jgi:hypothetical protein
MRETIAPIVTARNRKRLYRRRAASDYLAKSREGYGFWRHRWFGFVSLPFVAAQA